MNSVKKIPNREEIPQADKWAIEDLYETDELWQQELSTLAADQQFLSSFAGKLTEDPRNLYEYLQRMETLVVKSNRLGNYCSRRADEDTRSPKYQAMLGSYRSTMVSLNTATGFDTPEILGISHEKMEEFYVQLPPLERYRRYLTNLRRMRAHTLSAREETLLAVAGEMAGSPDSIYGAFMDADIQFPDAVDADGNRHPLTQGTFVLLQKSPDRILRRDAYEKFYDGFLSYKNTCAAILNAQNKQLKFFAEARNYESAFERSLDRNNVPTGVYDRLIEAVHENLPQMHRYIRLRKKIMGLEDLHFYDLYTPLVADADQKIPYDQAKQTIYEAMAPLGEDYRGILKEGFDNRWIDVYQNVGKRSGAYSAGAMVHPYVLMNYTGTLNSQFTLAHEMGHAIHSYLSNRHQNPLDAGYVIFVAEVASNCNEALLMHHLLSKTTDRRRKAYLINHHLEAFRGSIFRQTMFAEFERNIGQWVRQGRTLTAEILSEEYRRLNVLYYGDAVEVDHRIAMEWARIPHFYYNYYVYQYATGFAAAAALCRRILKEGEAAVQDYLNFLSSGCSKSPIDLLKGAGVDMTSAEPVNQALELFGELMDQLEALLEE